jgi:hypothetical protein
MLRGGERDAVVGSVVMRRRALSFAAVTAMTASVLVGVPSESKAASVSTVITTRGKAVGDTGYKLKMTAFDTGSITIDLKKTEGSSQQLHRYNFNVSEVKASKDLSRGRIASGGGLGGFGSVLMKFRATDPLKKKRTCEGAIVTKTRRGVLKGELRFEPDTQGDDFFGKIDFSKLRAKVKRVRNNDCQITSPGPCPPNEVALFAGEPRAGKFASGKVRVGVNVVESAPPASFIVHFVGGNTTDPTKMTYPDDLSTAQANFSVAIPYASGTLDFTANGPLQQVQTSECKGGKSWTSDARPGTVSGSVTVHFDSFGDRTVQPAVGSLQRWVVSG